jgi:hypothetical protein
MVCQPILRGYETYASLARDDDNAATDNIKLTDNTMKGRERFFAVPNQEVIVTPRDLMVRRLVNMDICEQLIVRYSIHCFYDFGTQVVNVFIIG